MAILNLKQNIAEKLQFLTGWIHTYFLSIHLSLMLHATYVRTYKREKARVPTSDGDTCTYGRSSIIVFHLIALSVCASLYCHKPISRRIARLKKPEIWPQHLRLRTYVHPYLRAGLRHMIGKQGER